MQGEAAACREAQEAAGGGLCVEVMSMSESEMRGVHVRTPLDHDTYAIDSPKDETDKMESSHQSIDPSSSGPFRRVVICIRGGWSEIL